MTGTAGITCRMHSRSTVQCINLETCVIGKTGYAISSAYPLSLGKGITLKRRSILGYVVMTSYVGEADNFKFAARDGTQLFQLVRVVGGKDYLIHDLIL